MPRILEITQKESENISLKANIVDLENKLSDSAKKITALEVAVEKMGADKTPDPVLTEQIDKLNKAVTDISTTVSTLPTTDAVDGVKTSVVALQKQVDSVDKSKASAADLTALDTSVKNLDTALKALAALPPDVSQAELDAAIAAYQAADKAVNLALDDVKKAADTTKTALDKAIADIKKQQTVESDKDPDLDDPNWTFWIKTIYDYSVPIANTKRWQRAPLENDIHELPSTSFVPKIPTAADSVPSATLSIARDIALPQRVLFRYIPSRDISSAIHIVTFPKGTFSGISYELLDAARTIIGGTGRGQIITADDTGVGLNFTNVPTAAMFARFVFQYKNGGNITYEYPIT